MGAKPLSLLLVVFRMLLGVPSHFPSDEGRGWLPLNRFSCKGDSGSLEEAECEQGSIKLGQQNGAQLDSSIDPPWLGGGLAGRACYAQQVSHLLSPQPRSLESLFAITACFDY